jgi:hypothetical protein
MSQLSHSGCVDMYVDIHVHICENRHTCAHLHIHECTHTHAHTNGFRGSHFLSCSLLLVLLVSFLLLLALSFLSSPTPLSSSCLPTAYLLVLCHLSEFLPEDVCTITKSTQKGSESRASCSIPLGLAAVPWLVSKVLWGHCHAHPLTRFLGPLSSRVEQLRQKPQAHMAVLTGWLVQKCAA